MLYQLAPLSVLVGTRVGETLAETSASLVAFGSRELEERPGIEVVRDLYHKTPNLVDFGTGNLAPAVRGVDATGPASGGLGFIAGTRPRMTQSVDGRPLSAFELVGGPTGLWDVRQVEIYRGPQTTLQGRNSIAGAIQVDTRDPVYTWEGRARVAAGTHDRERYSAMVSGPVAGDQVAFRMAADHLATRSFVDFTGEQAFSDIEFGTATNVRTKLLVEPAALPDLSALLTVSYAGTRRAQAELAAEPFGERTREVSQTSFETESTNAALELGYLLTETLKLSSATTWADIRFDRLDLPENGQFYLRGPQLTQEVLLNVDAPDQGLAGVVGGYLFHEDRVDRGFVGTPLEFRFDDETLTTALFAEFEWEVVDALAITAGARYEREDRERLGSAFGIDTDLDETFDAFLPKVGVEWTPSVSTTVGLEASRGFNAGGASVSFGATDIDGNYSDDPALGPRSFVFDSEFVWNYEAYVRSALLEDRLFLSANAFYSDFRDQQRREQIDYAGGFSDAIVVNSRQTRSYGLEAGADYFATNAFALFGNLGVLETEIVDALDDSLDGNEFARAPAVTANLGGQLNPIPGVTVSADARYVSAYFSNDENNPLAKVPGHAIVNARAEWASPFGVDLYAAVTNLFDEDTPTRLFSFPATAPPSLANLVDPRVIWIGLEASF